jgi:hypothetical protein
MQTNGLPSIDEVNNAILEFAERRKWHLKYAKFNWRSHQSLLAHCLNVSSLSLSILDFLGKSNSVEITEKLRIQTVLTGFLHDAGKESETFQRAVETFLAGKGSEPLDFGHQQEKDLQPIIESFKKDIGSKLPSLNNLIPLNEVIWSVGQLGRREDAAAISHGFKSAPSNYALICKEIVHLADILMSKLTVEDAVSTPLDGQITSQVRLVYSKVSTIRGILTHFLHTTLESQFVEKGYEPIQWFPDGTIYIGTKEADDPIIDENRLVESVIDEIKEVLDKPRARQMAKAAFGDLNKQVIAAPEFLFTNDEIIHMFWQFRRRLSKPNIKETKKLTESEKKLFKLLSEQLKDKDESTRLVYLARFISDFNLLIVLYAIRKQLIDAVINNKKNIESEATKKIEENLAKILSIPPKSIDGWPEIALQTKTEKRLAIALSLWQSPYYDDPEIWRDKLLEALEKATIKIASMWRNLVPEKYVLIANLLISDITSPISPKAMLDEVEKLNSVITEGKSAHGTPNCQGCGGVASLEAQAKLFGQSEIYHDQLIAGERVGGGNKIQVCELCEFEEKLRSIFLERGQEPFNAFFIFPQLALSRSQQVKWQATVNNIQFNSGEIPSLLRTGQWAKKFIQEGSSAFSLAVSPVGGSFFSEKEKANAIQRVADTYDLEKDLSSMIEPGLDAEDGKTVSALISQGKCKLREDYEREVLATLNQLEPIYLSPNFILVLTRGTVAEKNEPGSSAAIKWTLFRCLLARLFTATVIPEEFTVAEKVSLGYTPLPSDIILRTMEEKLNARKGWITIPELERSIRRLSALVLIARELSYGKADYGRATLLRLLKEEPGRVLHRMTSKTGQIWPKKLIDLLDTWYYGK